MLFEAKTPIGTSFDVCADSLAFFRVVHRDLCMYRTVPACISIPIVVRLILYRMPDQCSEAYNGVSVEELGASRTPSAQVACNSCTSSLAHTPLRLRIAEIFTILTQKTTCNWPWIAAKRVSGGSRRVQATSLPACHEIAPIDGIDTTASHSRICRYEGIRTSHLPAYPK